MAGNNGGPWGGGGDDGDDDDRFSPKGGQNTQNQQAKEGSTETVVPSKASK